MVRFVARNRWRIHHLLTVIGLRWGDPSPPALYHRGAPSAVIITPYSRRLPDSAANLALAFPLMGRTGEIMDADAHTKVMAHRTLSTVLGLAAAIGWGLFAHATSSSAALERDLRAQIAAIWTDRTQLIAEQDRLRISNAEQQVQSQPPYKDGTAASPTMAPPPSQPGVDTVGETGSVSSEPDIRASVKTAQMVLIRLGYGSIKADGVMGPSTRRALKAFERTSGLSVTGELGPNTVEALQRAARSAAN